MNSPTAPSAAACPSTVPVADAALQRDLLRAHTVARSLLGCDHLAADAVQEALIALWQQPAPPPQQRAWLVQAVVFRARALRRAFRRRQLHEDVAAHSQCELHRDCGNPLHHAFAAELQERLATAVQQLPIEQREPFELHRHGELDYLGIAAQLQVPVGTVRSRLHRARQTLQTVLGDDRTATPPASDRRT